MSTVIDLFCGAGGSGTGFSQYFDVVTAIDIMEDACKTYEYNHPQTQVLNKDVLDINWAKGDYQGILGMIGCPPCQDFSRANLKKNPDSDRANLNYIQLDIIDQIKPEFFFMENVATMPALMKERIVKEMQRMGYRVTAKVIMAADYGSVQMRRRWILTAHKKRHVYPQPIPRTRVAGDIFIGDKPEMKMRPETIAKVKKIKVRPGKLWYAVEGSTYEVYCIVDPKRHLPAVVNPTKLRYVRPGRTELMSFAEMYAAQGFPKDYEFFGNMRSKGQQLANAVPVEVASHFAKAISEVN